MADDLYIRNVKSTMCDKPYTMLIYSPLPHSSSPSLLIIPLAKVLHTDLCGMYMLQYHCITISGFRCDALEPRAQ